MADGKRLPRTLIQILWTALTNGFAYGFIKRDIFKGASKSVCLPGLNCYSCPGAVGSCPIGALQAVICDHKYSFSFYVVGALIFIGALLGRAVCGFLCPFGLFQDLLYKIPFFIKRKSLPAHKYLKYAKYAVFIVFICILPASLAVYDTGVPAFCKYVCPSGTLMGALSIVPFNDDFKTPDSHAPALTPVNGLKSLSGGGLMQTVAPKPAARSQLGTLFYLKIGLLAFFALTSLAIYRPFCKYICPLGAVYSLFAKVSCVRLKLDESACVKCGLCARACKMSIDPVKTPNSGECIRCGDCVKKCPKNALSYDTPLSGLIRRARKKGD